MSHGADLGGVVTVSVLLDIRNDLRQLLNHDRLTQQLTAMEGRIMGAMDVLREKIAGLESQAAAHATEQAAMAAQVDEAVATLAEIAAALRAAPNEAAIEAEAARIEAVANGLGAVTAAGAEKRAQLDAAEEAADPSPDAPPAEG